MFPPLLTVLLRSLSPVSSMTGEELTAALRRSRRRPGLLDKQVSTDSQDQTDCEAALDRVRFDDNVSFIEAISPESDTDKLRPSKVRKRKQKLSPVLRLKKEIVLEKFPVTSKLRVEKLSDSGKSRTAGLQLIS